MSRQTRSYRRLFKPTTTRWQRCVWSLKQLLPLPYTSMYRDEDGRHSCVWFQWFGVPFAISHNDIPANIEPAN